MEMNKTFEYGFGAIAVTMSSLESRGEDMESLCLIDITECVSADEISTMDQKELGQYIEFLQEVHDEMIEIDKKEGEKAMKPVENGTYEITKLLAETKQK
ncbi:MULTISPECIES: hypothetical protein [Bacillus]|uniref:hypothetical protein n=1 Tax=Bacillus TaxID=1386 RepID=UPI001E5251DF|nr:MULTISPECIES: hypothetical protein [Bacillus]